MRTFFVTHLLLVLRLIEASSPQPSESEWISISKDVAFQGVDVSNSPSLRNAQRRLLGYSDEFIDVSDLTLSEYSQAWRFLGLYVDCSGKVQERRRLEEEEEHEQEENEADGGDEQADNEQADNEDANEEEQQADEANEENEEEEQQNEENQNQQDGSNSMCNRYVLWAAYADLDYEGGGHSEYQMYDHSTGAWDESTCDASSSERCVKMDCHLPSTNFKLLGFYKQYDAEEFLQQLTTYQGSCLLGEEEYQFMENTRDDLPFECTQTGNVAESGNTLYYGLKPLSGGRLGIGLYEDNECSVQYFGDAKIEHILDLYVNNEEVTVENFLGRWNSDLAKFKSCQPCVTYDFSNGYYNGNGRKVRRLEEEMNGNGNNEGSCEQGTNQCMVFAEQTQMSRASYSDLSLASRQGTIVTPNVAQIGQSWWSRWAFFLLSLLVFVLGLCMFSSVAQPSRKVTSRNAEPLITSSKRQNRKTRFFSTGY